MSRFCSVAHFRQIQLRARAAISDHRSRCQFAFSKLSASQRSRDCKSRQELLFERAQYFIVVCMHLIFPETNQRKQKTQSACKRKRLAPSRGRTLSERRDLREGQHAARSVRAAVPSHRRLTLPRGGDGGTVNKRNSKKRCCGDDDDTMQAAEGRLAVPIKDRSHSPAARCTVQSALHDGCVV